MTTPSRGIPLTRARLAAAAVGGLALTAVLAGPAAASTSTGCTLSIPDGTVEVTAVVDSAGTSAAIVHLTYRWRTFHTGRYTVDRVHDEDGTLRGPSGERSPGTVERWTPYREIDVNTGYVTVGVSGHGGSDQCGFGV